MQEVAETTVLGDFDDASFTHFGTTTTFFRRDSLFMVRTEGRDGQFSDFVIRYTFGVDPLQQYLVEFPDGRLQPLPVAWDTRSAEEGGGRWFHLYPSQQIDYRDELHWTGLQQNWNYMCADCHSTNVRRGYDAALDRFETTWSEINVACEACHGPGSRHIEWAEAGDLNQGGGSSGLTTDFIGRAEVEWAVPPGASTAVRGGPPPNQIEVTVCAQCHSQRTQISEGYFAGASFEDYYLPSLLASGVYHPDGQQLDEVYTHGSFLQSRMAEAGVTCSDCHDPHGQTLRAPGNQLCAQCHVPTQYDSSAHHFHADGSEGAACVSCHMPATTYMVVDPRRDHSIRVPRPDLSVRMGVPNPCTQCHTDRSNVWAAEVLEERLGRDPVGFQRFAEGFYRHAEGDPASDSLLAQIARDPGQPAWVQASALARIAERPGGDAVAAVRSGVRSADPMVRRSALATVETLPDAEKAAIALPLLTDPTRIVRLQAAWVLAPLHRLLPSDARGAFDRASEEFIASSEVMADRPESRTSLGGFFGLLERTSDAETQFRAAIRLDPRFAPAYLGLADLYRMSAREEDAREILQQGLDVLPGDPGLHHALGLSHARSGDSEAAVDALGRAADLAPDEPRYLYAYAVALHSTGEVSEAISVLVAALEEHPNDRDILVALSTFHRDEGETEAALRYAERLAQLYPADGQIRALVAELAR